MRLELTDNESYFLLGALGGLHLRLLNDLSSNPGNRETTESIDQLRAIERKLRKGIKKK